MKNMTVDLGEGFENPERSKTMIITGTGFEGRARIIRKHCQEGREVHLKREPNNKYDKNAIAVYLIIPGWLWSSKKQIGYIQASMNDYLAKKMDSGTKIKASIKSFDAPKDRDHPQVALSLDY